MAVGAPFGTGSRSRATSPLQDPVWIHQDKGPFLAQHGDG